MIKIYDIEIIHLFGTLLFASSKSQTQTALSKKANLMVHSFEKSKRRSSFRHSWIQSLGLSRLSLTLLLSVQNLALGSLSS